MLSLEAEERSCPETVAAAVETCIAQNAGLSALQDCMAADGDLRLRYMQVRFVHSGFHFAHVRVFLAVHHAQYT